MKTFYFIVRATQGDNVGNIKADSEEQALQRLSDIYTGNRSLQESPLISFELITEEQYRIKGPQIQAQKEEEAGASYD